MLREIFSSDGGLSSTRVIIFILAVTAVFIASYAVIFNRDLYGTAALVASILGPAMTGKAVQSFAENRGSGLTGMMDAKK